MIEEYYSRHNDSKFIIFVGTVYDKENNCINEKNKSAVFSILYSINSNIISLFSILLL